MEKGDTLQNQNPSGIHADLSTSKERDIIKTLFRGETDAVRRYKNKVISVMRKYKRTISFVTGPTGCGKSTLAPPILSHYIAKDSQVIVTQPKIPQTEMIASYLSKLLDEPIGTSIGVMHGQCSLISSATRIVVSTVATAALIYNNMSKDVPKVFFVDEIHEMNIQYVAIVVLLYKRMVRAIETDSEFHIVFSTATMGNGRYSVYYRLSNFFSRLTSNANHVMLIPPFQVKKDRQHDVEIHYCDPSKLEAFNAGFLNSIKSAIYFNDEYNKELSAPQIDKPSDSNDSGKLIHMPVAKITNKLMNAVMDIVFGQLCDILNADREAVVLVFLPGIGEIEDLERRTTRFIRRHVLPHIIYKFHSMFSPEILSEAINNIGTPRVILSTDLAESSLTIEDCRYVVDSGVTRRLLPFSEALISYYAHLPVSSKLGTVFSTFESLEQRAGRVGRTSKGYYYGLIPPCCDQFLTTDAARRKKKEKAEKASPSVATASKTGGLIQEVKSQCKSAEKRSRLNRRYHWGASPTDVECLVSSCRQKVFESSIGVCDSAEFIVLRFGNLLNTVSFEQLGQLLGGTKFLRTFFINLLSNTIRLVDKEILGVNLGGNAISMFPIDDITKTTTSLSIRDLINEGVVTWEDFHNYAEITAFRIRKRNDTDRQEAGKQQGFLVSSREHVEKVLISDPYAVVGLVLHKLSVIESQWRASWDDKEKALYPSYPSLSSLDDFIDVESDSEEEEEEEEVESEHKRLALDFLHAAAPKKTKEESAKLRAERESWFNHEVTNLLTELYKLYDIRETQVSSILSALPCDSQQGSCFVGMILCGLPVFGALSILNSEGNTFRMESRRVQRSMLKCLKETKITLAKFQLRLPIEKIEYFADEEEEEEPYDEGLLNTPEMMNDEEKLANDIDSFSDLITGCMILYNWRKRFPRIRNSIYPYKTLYIEKGDNLFNFKQGKRYLESRGLSITALETKEVIALKALQRTGSSLGISIELNDTELALLSQPSVISHKQPKLSVMLERKVMEKFGRTTGLPQNPLTADDLYEPRTIYDQLEKELTLISAFGTTPGKVLCGVLFSSSLIALNTYEMEEVIQVLEDCKVRNVDQSEFLAQVTQPKPLTTLDQSAFEGEMYAGDSNAAELVSSTRNPNHGIGKALFQIFGSKGNLKVNEEDHSAANTSVLNEQALVPRLPHAVLGAANLQTHQLMLRNPETGFKKPSSDIPEVLRSSIRVTTKLQVDPRKLVFALKEFLGVTTQVPEDLLWRIPPQYAGAHEAIFTKQTPPFNESPWIRVGERLRDEGENRMNPTNDVGVDYKLYDIVETKGRKGCNPTTYLLAPTDISELQASMREFRREKILNIGGLDITVLNCITFKLYTVIPKGNLVKVPIKYKKLLGMRVGDIKDAKGLMLFSPKPCGRSFSYPLLKHGFMFPMEVQASIFGVKLFHCAFAPKTKRAFRDILSLLPGGDRTYVSGKWLDLLALNSVARYRCMLDIGIGDAGQSRMGGGNTLAEKAMENRNFKSYYDNVKTEVMKFNPVGLGLRNISSMMMVLQSVTFITDFVFKEGGSQLDKGILDACVMTKKNMRLIPSLGPISK